MQPEYKADDYSEIITEAVPHVNELRSIIRVMFGRWVVVLGTVIILGLIATAVFAPWIAPYDPIKTNMLKTLQQPSVEYLLGTDRLGRDILSRIIYGSRVSLLVGAAVVIVGHVWCGNGTFRRLSRRTNG